MKIKEFGNFSQSAMYVVRPGSYALLFDAEGKVATIRTPTGYYLPGGGQEQDESIEDAVIREVAEECRIRVAILSCLGTADELVVAPSEGQHYRKRCTFFLASVIGEVAGGEDDHELVWLSTNQALDLLNHGSHRWAVTAALVRLADGRNFEESKKETI